VLNAAGSHDKKPIFSAAMCRSWEDGIVINTQFALIETGEAT